MKWTVLVMAAGLWLVPTAGAQESTETTTGVSGSDVDLFSPLFMDDAVPVPTGHLDLRLRIDWITADDADIDEDDDIALGTSLFFGIADRTQLSLDVPFNVGDADNKEDGVPGFSGNGDATVGLLYRFKDQVDYIPAMAMQTNVKFRTGYRTSPVDLQFRLLMTNEYDSGIRSHINLSTDTDTGDLDRWNWDVVVGADGPLCNGGAVRWVADVSHQNSELNNAANSNYAELGTEWTMDNGQRLGLMSQFGLDDHEQTADFGARVMWLVPLSN